MVLVVAKEKVMCKNLVKFTVVSFLRQSSLAFHVGCLTKHAPDAGDSAQISGSFIRLIIFPVGRLRRPTPAQVTQTVSPYFAKHSGRKIFFLKLQMAQN